MSKVVNIRKEKHDVYIGRPSKWGNPFRIESNMTRAMVVQLHRDWLLYSKQAQHLRDSIHELTNKDLGCYCKPLICHGDVLLELANKQGGWMK